MQKKIYIKLAKRLGLRPGFLCQAHISLPSENGYMWKILDYALFKTRLQLFFSCGLADWLKKLASMTSPLTFLNVSGTANPLMKMLPSLICAIADWRFVPTYAIANTITT